MQTFTTKEAIEYAKRGELHCWVYAFLHTIGKNKGFAKGILRRKAQKKLFWVGPMQFPLKELTMCTGPSKTFEYPQTPKNWEKRVTAMMKSIKEGWEPPLLIVNFRPWPVLSIRDGNHRYEALRRSGKRKYWTLFYFESKAEQSQFVRKYKVEKKFLHADS